MSSSEHGKSIDGTPFTRPATHNEKFAIFLLPTDPTDPEWDGRVARALDFLQRNGSMSACDQKEMRSWKPRR